MSGDILDQVYQQIAAEPHASQSLLLFALMKTLDIQKGGHMYMLGKLKEMQPETRQLAYGLMEMMARGNIYDERWQVALQKIESAIRQNV